MLNILKLYFWTNFLSLAHQKGQERKSTSTISKSKHADTLGWGKSLGAQQEYKRLGRIPQQGKGWFTEDVGSREETQEDANFQQLFSGIILLVVNSQVSSCSTGEKKNLHNQYSAPLANRQKTQGIRYNISFLFLKDQHIFRDLKMK